MSKDVHVVFKTLNYLRDAGINLTDSEKLLLIFLAAHQGKFGIFPTIKMLVKEMNSSRSTILRLIKSLSQKQVILIEKDNGRRNLYRLNYIQTSVSIDTGVSVDTGVTPDTPPVSPLTPPIYIEITKEITNTCASDVLQVKKRTAKKPTESSAVFDRFWSAYPKKKDKQEALRIWQRDKLDNMVDEIIDSVEFQKAHDAQWQTLQYIPNPSTFLNRKRWTDEITPIQPEKRSLEPKHMPVYEPQRQRSTMVDLPPVVRTPQSDSIRNEAMASMKRAMGKMMIRK